jgi:hypothetical protein
VISADDGTGDKNSYNYYYTRCNGTGATGSRVNDGPSVPICAREGSVYGDGPIIIDGPGAVCGVDPSPTPTSTITPTPSETPPPTPTPSTSPATPSNAVTSVFGNAFDALGEIYISATVFVSSNVTANTLFTVVVSTSNGPVTVYVTIANGNNSGFDSTFTGMGSLPDVTGACISGCDDPSIDLNVFLCP